MKILFHHFVFFFSTVMSSINSQNLLVEASHVRPNFATDSTKFNIANYYNRCVWNKVFLKAYEVNLV